MTRIGWPAAVAVYTGLVGFATWPLALHLSTGVSDFGDPLLNAWTLAWVAHAAVTTPRHLFDANIFYPERSTLAYSETLLLPALLVAPVLWFGGDPILAHNLVLLAGYIGSGLAMFLFVRSVTSDPMAALVAGAAFALMPARIEQFPKLQLQLMWWWPLALLALHRLLARPDWRRAAALGALVAAECYTCTYYGVFGGVMVALVAGVLWLVGRSEPGFRGRTARPLLAAAAVAVILVVPLAQAYRTAARTVGERTVDDIAHGSATLSDYRRAPPESWLYGSAEHPGQNEHRLFPGYATPILAVAAFVPPVDMAAGAYLVTGLAAAELSLGANGVGYHWLYAWVWPLRAVRVVGRFAMVVGLMLSVLAGLGLARLRKAWPRAGTALALGALGFVTLEGRMQPVELSALDDKAPAVYTWLASQPAGVLCEFPVGHLEGRIGPQDATYMYYSTRHWHPLVNGYSGFEPPSYHALVDALTHFPDDRSIEFLRARGVTYLLVHSKFYIQGDYAGTVQALRSRADVRYVATFPWSHGDQTAVFLLR